MTPRTIVAMMSAALLLSLAACSTVDALGGLRPGASEADASALAHKTPYVWHNADGTRTLEYSNQPLDGDACYMVTVDRDGKVLKVEQVITDEYTGHVHAGMKPAEVRRILGEPRTITHFPLSGEDVWDWNTGHGIPSSTFYRFNVHFKDGAVIRTSNKLVDRSSYEF